MYACVCKMQNAEIFKMKKKDITWWNVNASTENLILKFELDKESIQINIDAYSLQMILGVYFYKNSTAFYQVTHLLLVCACL